MQAMTTSDMRRKANHPPSTFPIKVTPVHGTNPPDSLEPILRAIMVIRRDGAEALGL